MDTVPTGQSDSSEPVAPTCLPQSDELMSGVMEVDNQVLALSPPDLPEATRPVKGAHLGVPLRIYDLAPEGAKVVFDPYLNQRRGDTVFLNLNGQPGIDSVQTLAEDDAVTLHIPHKLLLPDVVNRITCTVKRGSENKGTSEPPLEVLYNKVRPGNQDTTPGDGAHSELELILSDAWRNGVGPDFPAAGAQVCVSYPYCRAFDRIRLNLNGHDVYHDVTEEEVPDPWSSDPVKVCFSVTRADLDKAGDHPKFNISYTVTDQLGNNPDPDSLWSAVQTIDVDLAGSRLPKALLREILDGPDDDPDIELEKLGANDLLIVVLTSDPRFLFGDLIFATFTARVTGNPDVIVTATGTVGKDQFGQKQPSILKIENKSVIAGSDVSVTYTLIREGASVGNSAVTTAKVKGEGLPALLAPQLLKSVKRVLDPLDSANLQGATGRVEIVGYLPRRDEKFLLIVNGAAGAGSPTFEPKSLNSNSRANFQLDSAFIAANLGKRVELSFVHLRGDKPIQTSPILAATIGPITDYHPDLPSPIIGDAHGGDLDVTQLHAQTLLDVRQWPHQVKNQLVSFIYSGTDREGKATSFEDKGILAPASGLSRSIPLDWLFTLHDSSQLRIGMSVNYSGSPDGKQVVKFPERIYTVKTLLVENFDNELSRKIFRANEILVTPVLTFKLLTTVVHQPNPAVYTHAEIGTGVPGKQLHWYVLAQEKAELTFVRACQKVSFQFYGNQSTAAYGEVHFYDNDGRSLGQVRLDRPYRVIEFSGLNIKRLELVARGNVAWVFDDFVLMP
ncbi:hypothetical protein PspR84_05865 [Pseudomonas sp. R84]|jgi:hypothetical protein|uniref:hypothetical protein n=1 Tax=Pseudomonas sp. R84 TaxID=1573712 RepID=UPI00131FF676|nr:hypothetical protein [Pseudomonas sp. R84]QHC94177.1 hypothetical protein PspR84_05865 [Pseudomonas sp. R84]